MGSREKSQMQCCSKEKSGKGENWLETVESLHRHADIWHTVKLCSIGAPPYYNGEGFYKCLEEGVLGYGQ